MTKKIAAPDTVSISGHSETPFLLYSGGDEKVHIKVLVHAETLWLPLAQIAELFGVQTPGIFKHLKNIFESGELSREATISKMETVQTEGVQEVKRNIEFYNLSEMGQHHQATRLIANFHTECSAHRVAASPFAG